MQDHPPLQHPITVTPHDGRIVVRFAGVVIADTTDALCLNESNYGAVYYLPRNDVSASVLRASARVSHCPFKGEASYWTVVAGGIESADAAWSYEQPLEGVAAIAGHIAFYPARVESIDLD